MSKVRRARVLPDLSSEYGKVRLGIATGADLAEMSLPFLQRHFGKAGSHFYGIARGVDHRPVLCGLL